MLGAWCDHPLYTSHLPPPTFTGSPAYLALERDSLAILSAATNDVGRAREAIRELFRERYKGLADDPRERAEAQTLYGSIVLRLELLEE